MAYSIKTVDWASAREQLVKLREKVFVLEWQLPRSAEFDSDDEQAFHIIVSADNKPVATARLTRNGEIGRVAILLGFRNLEVYKTLFSALLEQATAIQIAQVTLHCDLTSVEYHTELGFRPAGPAFMDAGIARLPMSCPINKFRLPDVSRLH
ncbi:GNAT family N-acetyltransferase [Salinimonas lutimaris]|uniref:GNAT family N-acetyltransferase n=1 Tax=Salinimonas lutimaris TaxID=914153 RepID=UPI0010C13C62|nr:GNAT family N-acetyltransferase [Salinimonas lutimaris]